MIVKRPDRLVKQRIYGRLLNALAGCSYADEETYFVGVETTTEIESTAELRVKKYRDTMTGPNRAQYKLVVEKDHERFVNNEYFVLIPKWAMKKKFRKRIDPG